MSPHPNRSALYFRTIHISQATHNSGTAIWWYQQSLQSPQMAYQMNQRPYMQNQANDGTGGLVQQFQNQDLPHHDQARQVGRHLRQHHHDRVTGESKGQQHQAI